MAGAGAGALSERVTIVRPQVVADGVGGQARTFVTLATLWAEVLPSRPGDIEAVADAAAGVQGYRVKIRHRDDIGIDNRIDWRGKRLKVLSAMDMDGRRAFLTIVTDAGVVND